MTRFSDMTYDPIGTKSSVDDGDRPDAVLYRIRAYNEGRQVTIQPHSINIPIVFHDSHVLSEIATLPQVPPRRAGRDALIPFLKPPPPFVLPKGVEPKSAEAL